jgi:hypothetical protein
MYQLRLYQVRSANKFGGGEPIRHEARVVIADMHICGEWDNPGDNPNELYMGYGIDIIGNAIPLNSEEDFYLLMIQFATLVRKYPDFSGVAGLKIITETLLDDKT